MDTRTSMLWRNICGTTCGDAINYKLWLGNWHPWVGRWAPDHQLGVVGTQRTNFDVANWCDVAGAWCEWHKWERENYEDALRVLVVLVAVFLEWWVQFAKEGVWRKARRRELRRHSWMLKIEWKRVFLRYVRACRRWIQMKKNSEWSSIFLCSLVFFVLNFKPLLSRKIRYTRRLNLLQCLECLETWPALLEACHP